jgi:hypothetical protein
VQVWGTHRWQVVPQDTGRNPFGVVPVVPLVNRARMLGEGESELARIIPIQDAVNKLAADMIVASEFASYRQRWAIGIDIPEDPVTHQPVEPFKAAVSRVWYANPKMPLPGQQLVEPRFGEFTESNLSNYVTAIEMFVQHIASQSRTPPHYFYLSGQFPSGESIKSAETGLVAKTRRKMRHFGEGWEEVMRLAFLALGNTSRSEEESSETIWGDPESRTESQHVDSVTKKATLGVPWRQLMEDLGYSPQQIDRMEAMRRQEQLMFAVAGNMGAPAPIANERQAHLPPGMPQYAPGGVVGASGTGQPAGNGPAPGSGGGNRGVGG